MLARVISCYYLFITMSMEKNLNLSDPPLINGVIVVWSRIWKLKSLGNGMIQTTASHAGVKSTNRPTRKFPLVFCKVSSPLTVVRSKYVVQHYIMQIWCNVNLLIYGDSPCETLVNKIYGCGRFSNAMCIWPDVAHRCSFNFFGMQSFPWKFMQICVCVTIFHFPMTLFLDFCLPPLPLELLFRRG